MPSHEHPHFKGGACQDPQPRPAIDRQIVEVLMEKSCEKLTFSYIFHCDAVLVSMYCKLRKSSRFTNTNGKSVGLPMDFRIDLTQPAKSKVKFKLK